MAGTVTRPALAWPVVRAFAGEDIELEWNQVEAPDALDALVARLVSPAERESFEGGDYTTRRWVGLARRTGERDFAWLIREGGAARPQSELANAWDTAQVPLRWTPNSARSVTHALLRSRHARLRTASAGLQSPLRCTSPGRSRTSVGSRVGRPPRSSTWRVRLWPRERFSTTRLPAQVSFRSVFPGY
jgi:hypothetical protein